MNLIDEYLRAVSILLPKLQRDDIIAELRDTILSRIEAREAELGRPLSDEETEAVLREVGHPVAVAARYREGPQHVVGPALYPYWTFVVKVGLALQILIAGVVLFARIVAGFDFGVAMGQAISSVISGGLVLVGAADAAAREQRGQRAGAGDASHAAEHAAPGEGPRRGARHGHAAQEGLLNGVDALVGHAAVSSSVGAIPSPGGSRKH